MQSRPIALEYLFDIDKMSIVTMNINPYLVSRQVKHTIVYACVYFATQAIIISGE